MKCSSRRNCSERITVVDLDAVLASMKCSSRRNCSGQVGAVGQVDGLASMKCSSRRNCSLAHLSDAGLIHRPQ